MYFERVALREGSVGRLRGAPRATLNLPIDLAGATTSGVYVLYVLGGDVRVSHIRHRSTPRRGSIVTFNGTMPARIKANGRSPYDIVTLEVPAARLSALHRTKDAGSCLRLIRETSSNPLASCMKILAEHMHTGSKEQLAALYEACVSLLVAEEVQLARVATLQPKPLDNPLLRDILDYTNSNICDHTLRPSGVANRFGISVRYLHKLFATSGVTFGSYVVMRRLDHVRNELVSGATHTIAELAQKWGFRDTSAFNKAFRKRFGCAPRRLRARAAS